MKSEREKREFGKLRCVYKVFFLKRAVKKIVHLIGVNIPLYLKSLAAFSRKALSSVFARIV